MPYNYSKLDGLITEKYSTQAAFAKAINMSERSVSLKMNGKVGWKQTEIERVCSVLNIDRKEIPIYFFDLRVQ